MKNIVLVGLMGAGKSSVGKLLAEKLDYEFIDTDVLIEQEQGRSIANIFSENGEAFFRNLESDVIKKNSQYSSKVIATGGGSVQNLDNLNSLKVNGFVIYLKADSEQLYERVKNETHRPLLQNKDPLSVLELLLESREKNYLLSDFVLETTSKNINVIVDEIIKVYNENA